MQSLKPKRSMRPSPRYRMHLAVLACTFAAFVSSSNAAAPRTVQAPAQAAGAGSSAIEPKAVLDRYCVGCHNTRLRTADLVLEQADTAQVGARTDLWEKVLRKVATGAMPPAGARRPDAATSSAFVDWLDRELLRAAREHPQPGRSTIHRLNRAEYANAIRDLLGLEIDARALLPADDAGYGFDNIADVLSVSPGLLERYMGAARRIARMSVGDAAMRPVVESYSVSRYLVQDDRLDERLPFGSRGGIAIPHYFPLDAEYTLKIKLQRTWRDEIRGLGRPHRLDVRLDRAPLETFSIGGGGERATWLPGQAVPNPTAYELNADEGLELRFRAKAGQRVVGISFEKQTVEEEGFLRPNLPVTSFEYAGNREVDPAIDAVMIGGPYNSAGPGETESRRRLFVCQPGTRITETACARQVLGAFARRAFRRPVTAADVDRLMNSFKTGRSGGSFERGIEFAVRRVLVSPEFLFRVERDPTGIAPATPHRISDVELASRLSFFLWSSIPDDALLQAAVNGQLKTTAGVEAQVTRMLADARAKALVSNFAGQWLYLRNVRNHAPDPATFPDFDDNLREAFQRETDLFIQANIAEDRSVVDLLTANFTFLNERLARHYGIAGVYGSRFRRVELPGDRRAGLLGHGSVLTVTSYPTRTSPVLRGKWLLENILGTPPPPPPANVPALNETGESGKPASVRERLELHRRDPVCSSCHARMDPLGFALENFDAIGRWRSSDDGNALDPSGALPDGTKFEGPTGLRQVLVARADQFAQTVTEKLLTFALGRGLEPYDMPIVRSVSRNAAAKDYRWSAVISGIVTSTPFQMRLSTDAPRVARSASEPRKVQQP